MRVISARMRHSTWCNTNSERHDEGDPGFDHDDEFLLRSVQFQRLSGKAATREPLSLTASNFMTLRCDHKSIL
jgi:hypothetical protein